MYATLVEAWEMKMEFFLNTICFSVSNAILVEAFYLIFVFFCFSFFFYYLVENEQTYHSCMYACAEEKEIGKKH